MSKHGTYKALNRLLTVLYRSLPMYLIDTSPWIHRGEERALVTLRRIAESNQELGNRVADYVIDHYGPPELGQYPIECYDMHDLALEFLLTRLVAFQKRDIASLQRCVADLSNDREAAALAEEALGAARGHLESLEELDGQLTKSTTV